MGVGSPGIESKREWGQEGKSQLPTLHQRFRLAPCRLPARVFLAHSRVCLCLSVPVEHTFVFPFLQELLQLEDRLGNVTRGAVQNTIERFTFPHKYKKVRLHRLPAQSRAGKGVVSVAAWTSLAICRGYSPKPRSLCSVWMAPRDFLVGSRQMWSGRKMGHSTQRREKGWVCKCWLEWPCTYLSVCSSTNTSVFVHQAGDQRGPTHKANRKYLRKQFKALLHKDKGVKKASKQCGIGLFWTRLKVSKLWNVPTDLRSRICRAGTQKYELLKYYFN